MASVGRSTDAGSLLTGCFGAAISNVGQSDVENGNQAACALRVSWVCISVQRFVSLIVVLAIVDWRSKTWDDEGWNQNSKMAASPELAVKIDGIPGGQIPRPVGRGRVEWSGARGGACLVEMWKCENVEMRKCWQVPSVCTCM